MWMNHLSVCRCCELRIVHIWRYLARIMKFPRSPSPAFHLQQPAATPGPRGGGRLQQRQANRPSQSISLYNNLIQYIIFVLLQSFMILWTSQSWYPFIAPLPLLVNKHSLSTLSMMAINQYNILRAANARIRPRPHHNQPTLCMYVCHTPHTYSICYWCDGDGNIV